MNVKIALLNTSDTIGGAAIACRRINDALIKEGIDSFMVVQEKLTSFPNIIDLSDTQLKKRLALIRFALEKLFFLFYEKSADIRFSFSLANTGIEITRKFDFSDTDIIHLQWINQGFLSLNSLNSLFLLKKPVVWTLHDMWAFTGGCHHSRSCDKYLTECNFCPYLSRPGKNDLSNKIWNRKKDIYANADITIATPSKWLADCAKNSALFHDKNVVNIPNPINTDLYKPADKLSARKHFNLPEDKIIIGFAALNTNNYYKGSEYLIQSLEMLHYKHPEFDDKLVLLMLGKNKKQADNSLPYQTLLPGYLNNEEDVVKFYQAIDIYILPSLEENLPNTIMESMSCGTPVIAFNTGGVPEMIDHKLNGYLAGYKSTEDIVSGIMWLLEDKERYNSVCASAREKVINNYSEKIIAEKYIDLYKEKLNKT